MRESIDWLRMRAGGPSSAPLILSLSKDEGLGRPGCRCSPIFLIPSLSKNEEEVIEMRHDRKEKQWRC
jgi:hypothetical protein